MRRLIDLLLEELEKCDNTTEFFENGIYFKQGYRNGLIKAMELESGKKLNANMTLVELKSILV